MPLGQGYGRGAHHFNVAVLDESNSLDKRQMERHEETARRVYRREVADAGPVELRQVVVGGQPFGAIVDCADNERIDLSFSRLTAAAGFAHADRRVTDKVLRSERPVRTGRAVGKRPLAKKRTRLVVVFNLLMPPNRLLSLILS